MTKEISKRQASPDNKLLLRARDRSYRSAKLTQGILVTFSVALPITGVLGGSIWPEVRPYASLATFVLLVLEAAVIDSVQKGRLKRGAKLQEQFDTDVFNLPWNKFVAGARVEPEDMRALSAKPLCAAREQHFNAWYEPIVDQLPLHLGRLVCQRTNITYDSRLRRKYGNWLLGLTVLFGIGLLFAGLRMGLNFPDFVMTLLVPFLPMLSWALKEQRQHANTATSLTNLGAEWAKIWERAVGGAAEAEVTGAARNLQDAIYQHRERSPLVFEWVYNRMRPTNEDEARYAAEEFVVSAKKALVEGAKA